MHWQGGLAGDGEEVAGDADEEGVAGGGWGGHDWFIHGVDGEFLVGGRDFEDVDFSVFVDGVDPVARGDEGGAGSGSLAEAFPEVFSM